jgi:ornithine decarboxylase
MESKFTQLKKIILARAKHIKSPFMIYDLEILEQNYKRVSEEFPFLKVFYAVKVCKLPLVIKTFAQAGAGFEVNSKAELDVVLKYQKDLSKLVNSAPVKKIEDIQYMYKKGLKRFAFDCEEELIKLATYAPKCQVYLRVFTSNHGSFALNTKFGADISDAENLINFAYKLGLEPIGITFTVGSQCNNLKNWEEGIKKSASLFRKFPKLRILDLGGGIPLKYSRRVLNPKAVSKTIENCIKENFDKMPEVWVEPGRHLAGNSAVLVSGIIGVRHTSKVNWIYLDTSKFSCFMELFQFKKDIIKYPVQVLMRNKETEQEVNYNIAGPTCDGTDIIAKGVNLPKVNMGDKLIFYNMGAYTLEYGSDFNGHKMPKVYYLKNNNIFQK